METEAEKLAQWLSEPSPLPWSCRPHDRYMLEDDEAPIEIADAEGETVADNTRYYPHQIKVADAEFIVARVNAHDALVRSAQEVMDYLEKYGPSIVPHLMDSDQNPGQRLRDALALARGGK